jgi:NAD+ diphosphatase
MEEIYTFAGNPLDRVSQRRRDAAWIASLLDDPQTRLLPFRELKPVLRNPSATALDWHPVAPWRDAIGGGATLVLLGIGDGRAHFALDGNGATAAIEADGVTADVRSLATVIPGPHAAILAEARSLLDWHARHGFCAQCGTASTISSGGWGRRCPNCRAHHYPRVDPVVIMLATDGDACLVGRGKQFPPGMFSALAGFIEPGETIEEAVRRELMEEASAQVSDVTYYATQPWPFPSSLMIGCFAKAVSREVKPDETELAQLRWIERHVARELIAGKQVDGIRVPPPIAIAHHLIRTWALGGK